MAAQSRKSHPRPARIGLLALAATLLATPVAAVEDAADAAYVKALVNQVLETEKTNVEIPWANPETGHRGIIVVERTFYRDRLPCRDYRRTIEQAGSPAEVIRGTGCRVGRGRWQLDEAPRPTRLPGAAPAAKADRRAPPPVPRAPTATPPASPSPTTAGTPPGGPGAAEAPPEPKVAERGPTATPKPPPFPEFTLPSKADL